MSAQDAGTNAEAANYSPDTLSKMAKDEDGLYAAAGARRIFSRAFLVNLPAMSPTAPLPGLATVDSVPPVVK